jgi:hypothetical protein
MATVSAFMAERLPADWLKMALGAVFFTGIV